MKKFISLVLAMGIVSSAFVLSACQNNDGNTQDSAVESTVSNTSAESKDEQESVESSVAEIKVSDSLPEITIQQLSLLAKDVNYYQKVPEFTSTAEVINAREITENKKIAFIPDNSNNGYTALVMDQIKNAASTVGFKENNIFIAETDGTISKINDALKSAIDKKSNITVMFGDINKDNLATSIETVQANGIEVVSSGCAGVNQNDHFVDNTVPVNFQLAGKLMADWTLLRKKGKVNALAVNNSDSVLSNTIYNGFAEEFKKYVSTATGYCTTVNGTVDEIGNGFSSKIKDELTKDPNINYIIVFDESAISDAVSAVEQTNSKAQVIATGGSKEAFEMAESGNIEMLVAQSYEWIAYATVDYSIRVMSGSKLPKEQDVPFRIVNQASIKKELEEDDSDADGFYQICFGAAFVDGYSRLWGFEEE